MLIKDDCLVALKGISENSIDSLVTDPPAGISFMGKEWDSGNNFIPAMTEVFKECLRVMKPGAHGLVWALSRTSHWTATALEQAGFEIRDVVTHLFGSGFPKSHNLGNGWGTALKPASEHWILVRKPCSEKTVAKNVEKWGTGGINIDGCRIGLEAGDKKGEGGDLKGGYKSKGYFGNSENDVTNSATGRFPANLVLSHNEDCEESPWVFDDGSRDMICSHGCPIKMLDEQSIANGIHSAGKARDPGTSKQDNAGSMFLADKGSPNNGVRFDDNKIGASRFFYVAKASKKDRNEGCEGMPEISEGIGDPRPSGQSMSRLDGRPERKMQNHHPTVKSTKLMEYLITLVTPPNGIVLDPFMGSGSTGKAAIKLGFKFIGIEKEQEYFEIAEKRITACSEAISNV